MQAPARILPTLAIIGFIKDGKMQLRAFEKCRLEFRDQRIVVANGSRKGFFDRSGVHHHGASYKSSMINSRFQHRLAPRRKLVNNKP